LEVEKKINEKMIALYREYAIDFLSPMWLN